MLPNIDENQVSADIHSAIAAHDPSNLQNVIIDMVSACFKYPHSKLERGYSETFFGFLIQCLGDGRLLGMAGSDVFFGVFDYDWGLITEKQRMQLLPALEQAFPRLLDDQGKWMIIKLLGDNYCNEPAYETLMRLRNASTADDRAQLLQPYGYLHVKDREHKSDSLRRQSGRF